MQIAPRFPTAYALPSRHERLAAVITNARITLPYPIGIRFDVDLDRSDWSSVPAYQAAAIGGAK